MSYGVTTITVHKKLKLDKPLDQIIQRDAKIIMETIVPMDRRPVMH